MKRFMCLLLSFLMISFIFSGCSEKGSHVKVTMSKELKYVDLTSYGYENEEGYDYYLCVLKVENNSDSDIVDLLIVPCENSNFYIGSKADGELYRPCLIKSNDLGYVTECIKIKQGITDEERNNIINQIKKRVRIGFGSQVENNERNIEKSKTIAFNLSDENYFNENVQYFNGIGSAS